MVFYSRITPKVCASGYACVSERRLNGKYTPRSIC